MAQRKPHSPSKACLSSGNTNHHRWQYTILSLIISLMAIPLYLLHLSKHVQLPLELMFTVYIYYCLSHISLIPWLTVLCMRIYCLNSTYSILQLFSHQCQSACPLLLNVRFLESLFGNNPFLSFQGSIYFWNASF